MLRLRKAALLDVPDDLAPFSSAAHHPGTLEHAQMLRDGLASHDETLRELRDGERAMMRQARHEFEARGIAERRKDRGGVGRRCGASPRRHGPDTRRALPP